MGGVNGEGGKGERLEWVGVKGLGGRKESREGQRAKNVGWTNGSRGLMFYLRTRKVFIVKHKIVRKKRANGRGEELGCGGGREKFLSLLFFI